MRVASVSPRLTSFRRSQRAIRLKTTVLRSVGASSFAERDSGVSHSTDGAGED